MGAFQNYPYADVHQLNLDWIIKKVKEVRDKEDELDTAVANAKESEDNALQSANDALGYLNDLRDDYPYILNGNAFTITDIDNDLGEKVNNALVDHEVVIVPAGDYALEQPIIMNRFYRTLIILGNITYNGNDYAIELLNTEFCKLYVNKIECTTASCIRVQADSALCELNEVHSVYLYGNKCIDINATGSGTSGVQHINFYSNYLRGITQVISLTSTGSCWCGEIKFYGGEINGVNATGIYTSGSVSAIRAYGLSFESLNTALNLSGTNHNLSFYGCRHEQAGNFVLAGHIANFSFEGATIKPDVNIDVSGLTVADGIYFRGCMYSSGGNFQGTEYEIAPNKIGYIASGRKTATNEYRYINNTNGGVIGGDLTGNMCPSIARITSTGTFALSDKYSVCGIQQIIIYAEKAGIVITNSDGSKTLLTTVANQSAWRITAASTNSYFSPSGYIVEQITPVI